VFNDASFATTITNTGSLNPTNTTIASVTIQRGVFNIGAMVGTLTGGLFVTGLTTVGDGTNAATLAHTVAGGTRNYTGGITINNLGVFNNTTGPAGNNIGDITVNTGGIWNNSNNSTWAVTGNVTNNGTFTSGSGTYTLSGSTRTINGTIQFTGISMSGTYTNNGSTTVTTTFNGSGTLTQAANSFLNISASSTFPTLNATANPNLVRYFGAVGVNVKATTYHNLQIDMNTAAITATGATPGITVNNNLNVTGGIFADGGFQTVGNPTGTLVVANGASIQYGAAGATTTNLPTNYTTANITLNPTSTTIYNTTSAVTVSATPSIYGSLTLSGNSIKTMGAAKTLQGNLTHNAGTFADGGFIVTVNGNITNAATINGAGKIYLTGGTANHTLAGIGSYVNLDLDDALGATFTGASPSISGILTQSNGTLSLNAGTTLTLNGSLAATGTGDFGGTTTSGLTINGTGPLGNTLRFNASAQNLSNLTLFRTSGGTVTLGSNINLNAASSNGITITTGLLYLGNFNATLNTTTGMSLGSATAMVVADAALGTGEVRKIFAAGSTSFTFAIGDATGTAEYTPFNLNTFTAVGGTKTIGIKVTDDVHPQMNSNGTQTNYITRYFTFSESGPATSYTYATSSYLSFINSASDIVGTLSTANAQINRYDNGSSTWNQLNSTSGVGQYLTASLLNNVTGQLGGNDFTVRLNPAQTYTWIATTGSGDWNTAGNWTPSRVAPATNDILQFINGGTPTATNIPTQTIGRLIIDGTDATFTSAAATQTLTISNTSGTNFTVANDAILRLSTTGANSTIIAFSGTNITDIAGLIEINANNGFNNTINFTNLLAANNIITGTITNNGGIVTSTNLTTTFGATSTYNHARNGGAIPGATWNASSNINITGITNTALTAFTGAFGNLTWNCSGQTIASPLTAASSVAGNLTVSAGTFSDGSFQITGNATGTLSVESGATLQIGTAAGATTFPTLFTNITLASGTPGSTVVYGSSAAQNVAALTYHNLTLQSSGAKTALGAITVNRNLAITGCQFNDGGFQITGNATGAFTMSAAAGSILVLGNTTVATTFPTNFTNANITLNSPSVVRYNSNLNQTVSNVPTYSVLQMQSAAGTPTKTLAGNTLVTGSATPMVNIGAGNTFNLGGFNLTLTNSGGTSPITNTGTISANTDGGSTIILNGTSHGFAPGTILTAARPNLNVAVNAAATVTIGQASPQVALFNVSIGTSNTLSLSAGAQLGIAGTYTNNGTLTANTSGTTITLNGSSLQTFTVGTYTASSIGSGVLATSGGLAVNNTSGVTLGSALNVSVLTLANGILTTTGTNLLTVTGTAVACVTGGSATSYVNGPLVRSFPASLVSGSTYTFPVGKANFNTFDLINPTTTLASTVRVEAFDATAGGTDGIGFTTPVISNRYWQASVPTGALTSGGTVRLLDASVTVNGNTIVGNSSTLTGTYNPLGGTNPNAPSSGYITSTANSPSALGFYKFGDRGCLSGTYTVGPTGNFPKLTNAIATLNGSLVCADIIFELQSAYDGTTGETFPLTINQLTYSGGPWTVTFRPETGATARVTSGTSATTLINLNGADRIILDGRSGGTGTTINWRITNTNTSGQTILFNNDATNNTLSFLTIEGVNTIQPGTGAFTNAGIIAFGNTAPALGNEDNLIDNCFIKDGATTPVNAIYSYGLSTAGLGNDNNIITNNRLANVWAAATSTSFINLQTGNSAWTINGNSFYQTASRLGTTGTSTHTMILISNTSGNGFTINNNFIGGTAASAGGTAWTQTGIADARFNGMTLSVGSATASNVQGNTFGNIAWAGNGIATVNSAMFHAIYVNNGLINIGTTTGNIIGNTTYPITITFNNTTISLAGTAYGIYNNSPNGQINIQNNTIGSISGAITASTSFNFSAIVFGQGTGAAPSRIINGNTISNITIAGSSGSAGTSNLYGIAFSSGSSAASEIRNNTIFSLTNNYSGTAVGSQVVGIQIPTTPNAYTITGNTIYGLSCAATHTSNTTSSAAIGISYTSSVSSGHIISNNIVHTLSATATAAAANVIGIYYSPALSGSGNRIDGNLIHSLALSTSSTSGSINGIMINQGSTTVSNNMIRLGLRADATNITTGYTINGINEIGTLNNYYFNSIYIGGTGVTTGTIATHAFLSSVATGTRDIQNNIFWNARSNSTGTGKHFAIRIGAITGLTISHNDLLVTGTGGILGNIGGTDNTSLTAFGTNNISSNPQFINPTGDNGIISPGTNDVDLHIQPSPTATPIEGTGINISGITVDFDNETRASLSPEDMGADAGDFTPIDLTPPTVSYTPFAPICNTVSVYTVNATITDAGLGSSVNVTAGTKPRLYFKKSTDANTLVGWQFVEATNATSPFSFDIDFSLIGGVSAGNTIQYFVTAQDQGVNVPSPNVAINSGTFAATPSSVALTSPAFPIGGTINSFVIAPCSGIITVGTGGDYPALTTATGVFQAINAISLTGNLTVNIISDISIEDGTHGLNQFATPYTVTIQSDGTARTVSGTYTGAALALYRLNGADRVTFNGGTTTQRLLTFRNTNTTAQNATFLFANDASNNQLNNLIIEGGATSTLASGVVLIGSGATLGTGNDNNTIIRCDIRDLTTATSLARNGIYAAGLSTTVVNDGNTIQDCNIFNFFVNGAQSSAIRLEANNAGWTISGNRIFQTATRTSTLASTEQYLLYINSGTSGGGFNINGNTIGYAAADGTGTYTIASSGFNARLWGLFVNASSTLTTLTNNIISGISLSTTSGGNITSNGGAFTGINIAAGRVDIGSASGNGNTIGAASGNGAISVTLFSTSPATSAAIAVYPSTTTVNTYYNTIGGIDANSNTSSLIHNFNAIYYNSGFSAVNVSNNTITNIRCTQAAIDQNLFAIRMILPAGVIGNVNDNSISELNCNGGSSGTGQVIGINITSGGIYSLNRNTIFSLTNEAINGNVTTNQSVVGISYSGSGIGQLISNNRIYRLIHTTTTGTVSMSGIYFSGSTNATHLIERNFIHSFNFLSSSNTANNFGVFIDGTSGGSVVNNIVRLGIRADGSSVPNSTVIHGIYDNSSSANNFHFNTVYIGGSSVSVQTSNTFAFRRNVNSGADNIRNNIFANARTGGGSSIHYAFATNTTGGYTVAGFDNNIFHSAGNTEFSIVAVPANLSAAVTPALRMQAFRAASTGNNLRSGIATLSQINFINATGDAANVNLRLNNANCAAGAGIAISGITSDFDGTVTRAPAPAIGAHESTTFNTIATGYDIYTPVVTVSSVPALVASCGSSQTITITATVTDVGLGLATGSLQPTLWWRLSSGSYASLAPTSSSGNTFTYTLNLTGITTGQTYHYYVAAQDIESPTNVFYSNFNATTPVHADVATAASPLQANPATFTVSSIVPLSGTVTVGSSGTYSTFGGTGGLFEAIFNNGLSGDLIAEVTGNIADNNIWSLNPWTEYCGSGYTLYIRPQSASVKVVSTTQANGFGFGFLKLQGADRVVIDGSFNASNNKLEGTGNWLTFRNNYSLNANVAGTIYMDGVCQDILIRNTTIEGQGHSLQGGNVIINTSSGSNLIIDKCIIKGVASNIVPNNLVYSAASGAGNYTITNCNLFDFSNFGNSTSGQRATAILISSMLSPTATWTISGNSIYNTFIDGTSSQTAISFQPGSSSNGNTISNNYIGGTEPLCAGSNAMRNNTNNDFIMLEVNVGSTTPTIISGNTIQNIWSQSGDAGGVTCIWLRGSSRVNIINNTIGHPTLVNNIQSNGGGLISGFNTGWVYGIYSQTSSTVLVDSNLIAGLASVGSFRSFGNSAEFIGTGTVTFTNNTIANSYNGASTSGNNYYGLAFINTANANHVVTGNTFNYLGSASSGPNGNYATAIIFNGNNQGATISRNIISNLFHSANGGESNGIHLVGSNANYTISNNMISMLNRSWLATYTTRKIFNGIHDWTTSGTVNIYHNTILVQGSQTGTAGFDYPSACYYRLPNGSGATTGANVQLRNNIFINSRTGNPTASSLHYCIDNTSSNPSTGWSSNYNYIAGSEPNNVGFWGSQNRTFAQWLSSSSDDANSLNSSITTGNSNATATNINELFIGAVNGNLRINTTPPNAPYPLSFVDSTGTPLASVTTDIDGEVRSTTRPDIGADEIINCQAVVVNTQPTPNNICEGSNTFFTVAATGIGLTYQWQVDTGSGFNNITNGGSYANAQTNQLNINNTPEGFHGYEYRVVISSTCTTAVNSSVVTLTVNSLPEITVNPTDVSVVAGSNTSFSTTATGSSTLTYVWQYSTNGGSTWSNVPNATPYSDINTASLNINPSSTGMNNEQYRVIVNNGCNVPDTSTVATLTVTVSCTTNTWTGAIDTLWNVAGNWSCGIVPDTSMNVVIPNVTNDPVITVNIVAGTKDIAIQAGGNLTMIINARLNVSGNFDNEGSFNFLDTTKVILLGNRTQTIRSSWVSGNINSFNNLIIDKAITNTVTALDNFNVLTKTTIEKGELVVPEDVVARSKKVELKDKLLIKDIGSGTKAGEFRVNE
jgi:hypothetical protein